MSQSQYFIALNLYRTGQLAQAESALQQVLALQTKHADSSHMLGIICYQTNRASQAVQHIKQALIISPRNFDYLNNYGLVLSADNQLEAALKSFQQAILMQPKDLDVQLNIGNTLLTLNRFEEAAAYYRRVLRAFPKKEDVRAALGHCLSSMGNQAHATGSYAQAEACFVEAVILNTQDATLYYNLGNAQRELGKSADAAKQYQKAIQIDSNDADTYNNLGNVQRELGQLDLAIASYTKALSINPALYHAKVHLVHQKQHICDWQGLDEDIKQIRDWVNTEPTAQISPFAFLAMPGTTPEEQKLCAELWVANRFSPMLKLKDSLGFKHTHMGHTHSGSKLRIGYLSADFRMHPLASLISEMIELHDKQRIESFAYSYGVNDNSAERQRLIKAFDHFADIRTLSQQMAAEKINADQIDILVDLTGFTQSSRTSLVALKPAPISLSWLGFPGTMGGLNHAGCLDHVPLFDYLISDSFITPASSTAYAEQLALLPG